MDNEKPIYKTDLQLWVYMLKPVAVGVVVFAIMIQTPWQGVIGISILSLLVLIRRRRTWIDIYKDHFSIKGLQTNEMTFNIKEVNSITLDTDEINLFTHILLFLFLGRFSMGMQSKYVVEVKMKNEKEFYFSMEPDNSGLEHAIEKANMLIHHSITIHHNL